MPEAEWVRREVKEEVKEEVEEVLGAMPSEKDSETETEPAILKDSARAGHPAPDAPEQE